MNSINNSVPAMLNYYGSQLNNRSAADSSDAKPEAKAETSQDPLADLKRFAQQVVARSEGGLLRAMYGDGTQSSNALQPGAEASPVASQAIRLPNVADLDRDEAAQLLAQVQKMMDAGMEGSLRIAGHNGDKQTDSLETYRQWLQEKGGISVYA